MLSISPSAAAADSMSLQLNLVSFDDKGNEPNFSSLVPMTAGEKERRMCAVPIFEKCCFANFNFTARITVSPDLNIHTSIFSSFAALAASEIRRSRTSGEAKNNAKKKSLTIKIFHLFCCYTVDFMIIILCTFLLVVAVLFM